MSNDKQPTNKIEAKKTNKINKGKYDKSDLEFMSSVSEAILAKTPSSSRIILYLVFLSMIWLIVWASIAEIDEITRGEGKIIPSGQNQVVQNLEGGIVSEILVKEGDSVAKDQVLLKIDNKGFASSYGESQLRLNELRAKSLRLDAEAHDKPFEIDVKKDKDIEREILFEKSLYDSNKLQRAQQTNIFSEQIRQRQNELGELESKISQLRNSYNLMLKEQEITEPLFKKGLVSEVEFLQLKRRVNDLKGDLNGATLAAPRIRSTIKEIENKLSEVNLGFRNNAKKELNEVTAEIARLSETQVSLEDRVSRTLVKSPVNGIVSKMMIHTVSGIVKPGMDIIEIVPLEDALIAEVKVKPSDVAFLRPGLEAMIKFTAYDFSIYGGLKGKVEQISADTQTNEKGETYYLVRLKTDKRYLGSEEKPLKIIVGMVVSADIITGKKTILDYLLKPILKTKQRALRER